MNNIKLKVNNYINNQKDWRDEINLLRETLLQCTLVEDFKWRHPCYTYGNKNIVIIQEFKNYCALLFPKGVLLKDPENILVKLTENVQADRQIRFTSLEEVKRIEIVIKDYVQNAIEVEISGEKVEYKETKDFIVVDEFQQELDRNSALSEAFENLTPGRQRGYLLYFSGAKQSKTRVSRIEKVIPKIMDGIGLNDR